MSHEIQADIDYVGAFLFETVPADPTELIQEESEWQGLPAAPPAVAAYRDSDIQGVACWNCAHFSIVGDPDNDGDIDGTCCLWESKAEGTKTCDRFTAHADLLRQGPHTSWQEDLADMRNAMGPSIMEANYADNAVMNLIQFSGSEAVEEDGLIWKNIIRTGKWTHTPTKNGVVKRPLQIVRDGVSDAANGILSLSEVLTNFNDNVVQYVTVPLSDDDDDHKDIARLNTGLVKKLKLVDEGDRSYLRAGIDFTEPDTKEKILRGTYPDVSAAIPFGVTRRDDNKVFNAVLDHVCITRRPFISDLGPFGIAAADGEDLPVEAFEQEEAASDDHSSLRPEQLPPNSPEETETPEENRNVIDLSHRQLENALSSALQNQLRLSSDYQVVDVTGNTVTVAHRISQTKWEASFDKTGNAEQPVRITSVDNWKVIESPAQEPTQVAASNQVGDLTKARELRELRLSQPTGTGGSNMSVLSLDGVELSDLTPEARARIQSVLDENVKLRKSNREGDIDSRINELKELGFSDRPGALKFYRQVALDDDGGVAVVMFSDKPESERKRVSAIEILDQFIDALKVNDSITFSDQHFESGNDNKPPEDASGEKKPLEERVEESRTALYGDKSKRRTGRK